MVKNIISQISVLFVATGLLFVSMSGSSPVDFSKYATNGVVLDHTVEFQEDAEYYEFSEDNFNSFSLHLGKSYIGFKEALAFKESRGNYFRVNTYGYLGKYQFGTETLKLIGVYNTHQFLNNPELQEKAFVANLERNKWVLRRDIKKFAGKRIKGILITESGILAAAHLAGPGGVKKYLRSYGRMSFSDAYGTSIQNYMKRFSGYDTSFIRPNKKAKVSKV